MQSGGEDATIEKEDYASLSNLLPHFTTIPNIHKAWLFNYHTTNNSKQLQFITIIYLIVSYFTSVC